MINDDIFKKALEQYNATKNATEDVKINHVEAINKALGIDSDSIGGLGIAMADSLKKHYLEDMRVTAAAVYGLQIGILAGRQEAIENTSGS